MCVDEYKRVLRKRNENVLGMVGGRRWGRGPTAVRQVSGSRTTAKR